MITVFCGEGKIIVFGRVTARHWIVAAKTGERKIFETYPLLLNIVLLSRFLKFVFSSSSIRLCRENSKSKRSLTSLREIVSKTIHKIRDIHRPRKTNTLYGLYRDFMDEKLMFLIRRLSAYASEIIYIIKGHK